MFPALRDFITKHGFDAFVSNVERATKVGGIRFIPLLAEEWSLFEDHEEYRVTFPGNVTIGDLCDMYGDEDGWPDIEHVYILSRWTAPLLNPQSAHIAHVDIKRAFSCWGLKGNAPGDWKQWSVSHMPETTETTGQLSFSI